MLIIFFSIDGAECVLMFLASSMASGILKVYSHARRVARVLRCVRGVQFQLQLQFLASRITRESSNLKHI